MIQMPEVLARIYLCPVKSFGELILHAMWNLKMIAYEKHIRVTVLFYFIS